MTGSTVIKSEVTLFSELFHKGVFRVPWHQRYYDWKKGDVQALLQDVKLAIEERRDCYFLGAIMLIQNKSRSWVVNDGQQRMVTVSLACAVLCRRFARESPGSQREGLALRLLFNLPATSASSLSDADRYTPRIAPPDHDAMRYRQMIRGNTIGTNGMLTVAWEEIDKFFSAMSLADTERYFDFLLGKLEVACLWIPPQIDPNAIFETINCRGKPLDDLDLTRNFLYSHFNADEEEQRRRSVHEHLERVRTTLRSQQKASEYMRCRLQCRYGFLRRDHLYRDARDAIRTQRDRRPGDNRPPADYAFELAEQLGWQIGLELFRTMTASNPDPDFLRGFEQASGTNGKRRRLAVYLQELKAYKVTQPLVFALLSRYVKEQDGRGRRRVARRVDASFARLAAFVMRTAFVAPKFEPSHFETEFSNFAKLVESDDVIPDKEFRDFLKECDNANFGVLDDSRFREAIAEGRMTGDRKIKQFLFGINSLGQRDALVLDERQYTIEHVLPKSPRHWGGWTGFTTSECEELAERVGNLTLLGQSDNKPGDRYNASFARKHESFRDSGVALTRELAEHDDWTPAIVRARQEEMAGRAARVWVFAG